MISSIPKWLGNLFETSLRPNMDVVETTYVSTQIKKIRLRGDISKMNFQLGYANVIRVSETEFRNYTVAAYDDAGGTIDILCHIHGKGTGSRFMDGLRAGDQLYMSIPRGKKFYEGAVSQYVLFGDETSLGLANAFLPTLKSNKHDYRFYFELDEENRRAPDALELDNVAVFPKSGIFRSEPELRTLPIFASDRWQEANFVLTGNVASMQNIRKVLKGWARGKVSFQGYWLEGKQGL